MHWSKSQYLYVCCLCFIASVAATSYATTEQPAGDIRTWTNIREIGYSVGDIARQRIIVDVPKGYRFEQSSLPKIGKTSDFIELRNAAWQFKDTNSGTRYIFELDWQVFQVLQEIKAYPMKPLNLQFRLDDNVLHATPDPGHVIVSSVLPTFLKGKHLELLPDVEAKPRQTLIMESSLVIALLLSLASIAYFCWYFDWWHFRTRSSQPYRMASREIRAIQKNNGTPQDQLLASMKSLRRASDMSVGFALSKERLDVLFERNRWLEPMQSEIEKFYADSETLFFSGVPTPIELKQLYQLSLKLRALESRA